MSRQRFVSFDDAAAEAPLFAYPYDGEAMQLVDHSLEYLHGKGRWRRLRALGRLLRLERFRSRIPVRGFLFTGKRIGR